MNRDALLVGINQYPFLKDSPTSKAKHLNTPASDAEAIALRLEEYGGFRVRRLPESIQEEQRRVDPKKLVQGDALHEAIIQLFNPVGDSVPQTALLYFAGHGLRRNLGGVTEGFLATSDSDPRKNQWGVSLRWLRELLQRSPVQQQIVWLDCCYSGELLNFAEADLGTAGHGRTRFFIAAAREFEPAEENIQGQHGVFSQVLWEGLDPRRQPEGVVNNDRLIEYIDQTLKGTPQQPIWYNPNCEILLTGEREEVFVPTPDGVCPYKGLRFFDVEDAPYFYGREALTQKLIERVQVGKGNFLAVLGVSGSSKSSVLRAGLMYQLQQERRLPGTEQWKIRIFTPGEQPLVSLATAFLDEEVTDIERAGQLKTAEEAIAQGATGLARLIRASKSPRTVLIVDQFEEIFTVCQSQTERQQFISSLLDALKQTGDKLCLIFAMRDDFLGKCAAYRELADLIQVNLVMVTPMNAQELRQAIVEPAKKLGRKVEENLISAILKDLAVEVEQQTREPEPGMLPLLSYTLEQLWQRQTLNWLKLDSYNQLGGVQKTLENLAEQAYRQLSVEEQRVADQIFIKLTQLGEGTPDTRKQVPQQDLVTRTQSAELVERVIQKLAQAKLIVTSEQRKGQEKVAVVDVAHEALIRYWSRLRDLLDNNREAIRTEQRIQAAAEEWREKGKSKDYLLTGLRLGEAEEFLQDEADIVPLSDLAKEFIEESRKERDHLIQQEEGRRQRELEQERKARKAAQTRTVVAVSSALVVGAVAIVANFQRLEIKKQAELTALREKAATARNLLPTEPGEGLALSIHATGQSLSQFNKVISPIQYSLSSAIEEVRGQIIFLGHEGSVLSVAFSPDGRTIVSGSEDQTLRLWDLEGNPIGQPFKGHKGRVNSVAFSPNGKFIVSGSEDETTLRLWDLKGNPVGQPFKGHEGGVNSVAFSPDGKSIVSASRDGTVRLWDLRGNYIGRPFKGHDGGVNSVAFSPDGKSIVSSGRDGTVRLWDLRGNPIGQPSPPHYFLTTMFCSVAFSPDGTKIVGAMCPTGTLPFTRNIRVWGINQVSGKPFDVFKDYEGHERKVTSVAFSPNGENIISASEDGTVRLWPTDTSFPLNLGRKLILRGDKRIVNSVAFSPNGKQVVSANDDGTIRLWELSGINIIPIKYTEQNRAYDDFNFIKFTAFSPNGQLIATGDKYSVRLWDLKGNLIGQPFKGHEGGVTSVAFSPDGKTIVSGSDDKTLRLWDLKSNLFVSKVIRGHEDAVLSVSFSPDSRSFASAGADRTLRFWDLSGDPISPPIQTEQPTRYMNDVSTVAFSPDGKMLVTSTGGKGSGSLNLLRGNWQSWLEAACSRWRYYSIFITPETDAARGASTTCQKYVWSKAESAQVLVKQGRVLAQAGDVKGAVAKFKEAQKLAPSFALESETEARRFAAPYVVSEGEKLAKVGDIDGAVAKFKKAREWDSRLNFEPNSKARQLAAQSLLEESRSLAYKEDVEGAFAKFKEALKLAPSLDGDPNAKEARQVVAQSLVTKGQKLAQQSHVKEAIASYAEAQKLAPALKIYGSSWGILCSLNNLWEYAADVMSACEKAVVLEPRNAIYRYNRGVARAITNNVSGAIDDFQTSIELTNQVQPLTDSAREGLKQLRLHQQGLIEALRLGQNPMAANALLWKGARLAEEGEIKKAVAAYAEAQKLDPELKISAASWNGLCWYGSLHNKAADVMNACERAVVLDPKHGGFRDSRGLARALTGNTAGAIEDFQVSINWIDKNKLKANANQAEKLDQQKSQRQRWIDALHTGKNPFTAEELSKLFDQ